MSEAAISIRNLRKTYATGKQALDDVSFDVERGSIFGLLGPNGAGKSTIINILAGLVSKTSGQASIWGFDIDENPRNAKVSIGIVPQEITFDPFFTPLEMLELYAGLYGVRKENRRSMELLRAVRLEDKAHAYSRTLSGGMKRRLLVAKAMVHSPPVIVLDEPTAGVDIELRQQLWEYVVELNKAGTTVVLTTHYLEEAEQLCDRVGIVDRGKLIALGTPRELVRSLGGEHVIEVGAAGLAAQRDDAAFAALPGVSQVRGTGDHVSLTVAAPHATLPPLLEYLQGRGLALTELTTRHTSLEDVFVALTGRHLRDGEVG